MVWALWFEMSAAVVCHTEGVKIETVDDDSEHCERWTLHSISKYHFIHILKPKYNIKYTIIHFS